MGADGSGCRGRILLQVAGLSFAAMGCSDGGEEEEEEEDERRTRRVVGRLEDGGGGEEEKDLIDLT